MGPLKHTTKKMFCLVLFFCVICNDYLMGLLDINYRVWVAARRYEQLFLDRELVVHRLCSLYLWPCGGTERGYNQQPSPPVEARRVLLSQESVLSQRVL